MSGPFQVLSHQSLRSDNDVPRDGVRKLSDVSWPLCVLQVVQRLPAERLRSHAELFLATRSEEHTSELQSRLHLVCRLLLEKKKNNPRSQPVLDLTPVRNPVAVGSRH